MRRIAGMVLMLGLAGCSAIPNSGPVVQGAPVDVVRNDGYVRVIARPPARGVKPEALVRGFLNACASVADGDDTAREYLTTTASRAWNPAAQTEVYDAGALSVTLERNDKVRVVAPLLGTIDARHRYRVADPGASMTVDLHVKQVDGEWRIDEAPAALYLGQGDVARGFRAHPVYFLNQSHDRLVPEFTMLPLGTRNVMAALARAVTAGPVQSGMETAARGELQVLFANDVGYFGATTVGLDRRVLQLPMSERDAFLAQLTWTLTALPNISSVSAQVNGQALGSSTGDTVFTRSDFRSWDPSREMATHNLLYIRAEQVWSSVGGTDQLLNSGVPTAEAALSADGRTLVAVSASRRLLSVSIGGSRARYVASGSDLAAPAVLGSGETWFVDRESNGRMFTWDLTNGVRPVETGLPARARILDFAIAPDEVRIALIVNNGATTTVRVGTIVQGSTGARLVGLARVEQRLSTALAIAWTGESELGVIGAVGAVAVQPVSVTLPLGTVSLIGGPANAVSLAAVPGAATVVGDQAGQLWEYRNGRWDAAELGSAPSYAR